MAFGVVRVRGLASWRWIEEGLSSTVVVPSTISAAHNLMLECVSV